MSVERPNSPHPNQAVPKVFTRKEISECLSRMKTSMSRYIRSKGIDHPDDILQEVAFAALKAKQFNFTLESYIFQCVKNLVATYYREMERRPDRYLSKELSELEECGNYMVSSLAEKRAEEEAMRFHHAQAIGIIEKKLSANQAIVLKMFYVQNMSTEEIAGMMGTNQARIRQLKRRGLQKLSYYMASMVV